MSQLGIAVALQAMFQSAAEHALARGHLLSRREFLTSRVLVWLTPIGFIKLAAMDPTHTPRLAPGAGAQLHAVEASANRRLH